MKQITFYITGFIVLSALLTSCVSKKKFDELARAKRMSDREIASLQNEKQNMEAEIQQLKSDFNAVRYQLTLNNAAKDKQIDELYTKLRALESKENALKTEYRRGNEPIRNERFSIGI